MMNIIIQFIKKNWLIILSAIFCFLAYFLPIYVFYNEDKLGNGIMFMPNDCEAHYAGRVNEVFEGDNAFTSTFLNEYKYLDNKILQYGETIFGNILKFIKIDVIDFYFFSKPIFILINFLLWYYLFFLITKKKTLSLFTVSLFMLAGTLFDPAAWKDILSIITWQSTDYEPLVYSRFVNPLLTYPFLLFGLIRLYLFYERKTVADALWLGLAMGIAFYIYFYFWFYLITLAGVLGLYYLLRRDWENVKKVIISIGTALFIGAYYISEMMGVFFGEINDATGGALNVFTSTHRLIFSSFVLAACAFFTFYLWYKKKKAGSINQSEIFIGLMLISSVLVVNQQVLSGTLIEEGHFHWYINKPVAALAISVIIYFFFEKFIQGLRLRKIILAFVFFMILAIGAGVQASGYRRWAPVFKDYSRYGAAFVWLNENSKPGSVVLANDQAAELIPAYTHNDVYYAPNAKLYQSTPLERRIQAAQIFYRLYKPGADMDSEEAREFCHRYSFFLYSYDETSHCPEWLSERIRTGYEENGYKTGELRGLLDAYRLDYIIWDQQNDPQWPVAEINDLEMLFESNGVKIFRYKQLVK
jgi:hypothetical protein